MVIAAVYVVLGLLVAVDCYLYSVGLMHLPVSTYSLICASQLGFNALFSYFLNLQKFTPFIVNSLVLLTLSSTLLKKETFTAVMDMAIAQSTVATAAILVGLFATGEWKGLEGEMEGYKMGKTSYLMNLIWTAVSWQLFNIGAVGLIFEVSSLFSNSISAVGIPVIPVLAVVFFCTIYRRHWL